MGAGSPQRPRRTSNWRPTRPPPERDNVLDNYTLLTSTDRMLSTLRKAHKLALAHVDDQGELGETARALLDELSGVLNTPLNPLDHEQSH